MTAGVVTVGGKKYAVGLYWEVSDSSNAAKAARNAAQQSEPRADFYCIRAGNNKGRAPQFGLGDEKTGHKWGMPTAAATLANRQPGSWAGVFVVPEGVWFIEVRDDLIAPEGDILFADEAEAMGRLQETSARGGLERIYAPASWAIPGAEGSSLASLISGKGDVRLRPVKIPQKVIMMGAGIAAALVVLVIGIVVFMNIQAAQEEQEMAEQMARQAQIQQQQQAERARLEEEERQRRLQQQALQAPTFQRVWEQAPTPLAWFEGCRKAMEDIPVAPLGWDLSSLRCTGTQVFASWNRTAGPADIPPGADLESSLRSASRVVALPQMQPRGEQILWPGEALSLYILRNDWQAEINYLPDEPPATLPDGQKVPPPPWVKRGVRWTVPLSPWTLKGPLVDLPGFVIQNLTWSRDGNWVIEGVVYEQRK
jgi:hypothetical protein